MSKCLKKSLEIVKSDDEEPAVLNPNLNYQEFLQPKSDRVFEFKSKRIEFRRRPQHRNSQLIIINFDGVIGDITQKNLFDENYQLLVRHGTV